MVMTGISETRFGLDAVQGNEIVDFAVLDSNYQVLGNNAAHLSLGNTFAGNQLVAGNLGITGVTRRLTIPVGQPNQQDCLVVVAEQPSNQGTWLVFATPATSGTGQRRTNVALHGVMPTGSTPPAGLLLTIDEDARRVSVAATNTFQDSSVPSLTLAAGGTDRIVIPGVAANPLSLVGAVTMTGALTATNGTFSGTFGVTGPAAFGSTVTVAGNATFNGALTVAAGQLTTVGTLNAAALNVSSNAAVTGSLTVSGGLTTNSLTNTGNVTINGALAVMGAATFNAVVNVGGGGAYIQPNGNTVQISQLTVTPGATTLGGTTVNGAATINGGLHVTGYFAAGPIISAQPGDASVSRGNNTGYIWIGNANYYYGFDGTQYYLPNASLVCTGEITSGGSIHANSQVFTTPGSLYLRAADGNVHIDTANATLYVSGPLVTYTRVITNGWDVGWANNFGGNVISSSYIYQRANGSCRVWDNFDFNYSVANYGNQLVQRDAGGNIAVQNITAYGGMNAYVGITMMSNNDIYWSGYGCGVSNGSHVGRSGDTVYLYNHCFIYYNLEVGHDVNVLGGWCHMGSGSLPDSNNGGQFVFGSMTLLSYSGNMTFDCQPNQDLWCRQTGSSGWAAVHAAYFQSNNSVDHAVEYGLRNTPVRDALTTVKAITGYSYDHIWYEADRRTPLKRGGDYVSAPDYGFKPSEVKRYFPELVADDPDTHEPTSIDFGRMVPVLWEAVKELSDEVDALRAKLAA